MLTGTLLGAAIADAIKRKGVSQVAVAQHFGVRPPSVQDWIKRGTIAKEKLPELWRFFEDVAGPEHWGLPSGFAVMETVVREGRPVVAWDASEPIPDDIVLIKESRVRFSGGDGHTVPHYEQIEESAPASYRRSWFRSEGMNPADVLRFEVKGDSMENTLFSGDTVMVHLRENDVRDGKVYAFRYGDELRIKRLYKRLDGTLDIRSDNTSYPPEQVSAEHANEHITIIGRVREKAGKGGL